MSNTTRKPRGRGGSADETPAPKDRRVAQRKENPKNPDPVSGRVPLEEPEMIEILEGLARDSRSATAQIAAIKTLREINGGEQPAKSGFDLLDGPAGRGRLRAV